MSQKYERLSCGTLQEITDVALKEYLSEQGLFHSNMYGLLPSLAVMAKPFEHRTELRNSGLAVQREQLPDEADSFLAGDIRMMKFVAENFVLIYNELIKKYPQYANLSMSEAYNAILYAIVAGDIGKTGVELNPSENDPIFGLYRLQIPEDQLRNVENWRCRPYGEVYKLARGEDLQTTRIDVGGIAIDLNHYPFGKLMTELHLFAGHAKLIQLGKPMVDGMDLNTIALSHHFSQGVQIQGVEPVERMMPFIALTELLDKLEARINRFRNGEKSMLDFIQHVREMVQSALQRNQMTDLLGYYENWLSLFEEMAQDDQELFTPLFSSR